MKLSKDRFLHLAGRLLIALGKYTSKDKLAIIYDEYRFDEIEDDIFARKTESLKYDERDLQWRWVKQECLMAQRKTVGVSQCQRCGGQGILAKVRFKGDTEFSTMSFREKDDIRIGYSPAKGRIQPRQVIEEFAVVCIDCRRGKK